ncbi:MAG: glycosyltransferase N-terminal domain-containing protein [Paracoccus sp. (in: a-proteobacteria)]|nr:glycosyltransferase N-terminal domain-containing protein [Paracoccus sp. (in: a-proteobacteria)]
MSAGARGGQGIGGWLRRLVGAPSASLPPPPVMSLPTGEGPLIWMRIGAGYDQTGRDGTSLPPAMIQLLVQMRRRGLQIAVSRATGALPDLSTRGVSAIPDLPFDDMALAAQLDALAPAAILLIGADLPGALISAAEARAIPVILAEARLAAPQRRFGLPLLARLSPVAQISRLLMPDAASRTAALALGAAPERVELTGPITLTREPLPHNEAERAALAEAFQGRQLWLAVCVTEAELDAVIEAHLTVLRYSHRAMLILLTEDPARAAGIAARMEDAGLIVAQRSLDEDPTDEVNVYLADELAELGLWYRLAPLCLMGTTIAGPPEAARVPFEAASLGSAAIHGPQDGPFGAEWAQLDGAGAARRIADGTALPQAVVTLLAPDQAAQVAANAWSVSTGGVGVANRIAEAVRETISGARA